jgi:hypothetical protein
MTSSQAPLGSVEDMRPRDGKTLRIMESAYVGVGQVQGNPMRPSTRFG